MEKGFARRRFGPVFGTLVLLGLTAAGVSSAGAPGAAAPSLSDKPPRIIVPVEPGRSIPRGQPLPGRFAPGKTWWDVSLVVSVKGIYTVDGPSSPSSGSYVYRALWAGRLELDSDEDLLLVHLGTEVLEWSLRERSRKDGRESVLEAASGSKPALRLEYLIKDGADVEFVFGIGEIRVPLHAPELAVALDLPRSSSRQPGPPGRGYGDFVCGGSCRVAIPQEDLDVQGPERRFAWEWSRDRELVRAGRPVKVTHRHSAEAVVTIGVH